MPTFRTTTFIRDCPSGCARLLLDALMSSASWEQRLAVLARHLPPTDHDNLQQSSQRLQRQPAAAQVGEGLRAAPLLAPTTPG